ncbi:telomeric repeat binding factor a [Pholidichthys leucotaenia]
MAATEYVKKLQTNKEGIVNRWFVDYCLFQAIEFFKNGHDADFCEVSNVLNSLLVRPCETSPHLPKRIQVWRLLSLINESGKPDLSSQSVNHLESALVLLENMKQESNNIQQEFETVSTLIKEMIMALFIKDGHFVKAKEKLNKYFPKATGGKKDIFMELISQKCKCHEVIEQINFKQFKKEMLNFCQRLCTFPSPFLYMAANRHFIDREARTDEQAQPGPSSRLQLNGVQAVPCSSVPANSTSQRHSCKRKHSFIQRSRLELAYRSMAPSVDERTFAQLEEEVEMEQSEVDEFSQRLSPNSEIGANVDSDQDKLFNRHSGSPMEASPAEQPPQTAFPEIQMRSHSKSSTAQVDRRVYTVSRLVMEPDSQPNTQGRLTSENLEMEVTAEKSPQKLTRTINEDLQCPVTDHDVIIPTRKHHRLTNNRASNSLTELSSNTEEDSLQPQNQLLSRDLDNGNSSDSSLDSLSPSPQPQKSSTPHKGSPKEPRSKWKTLMENAKETKETWPDDVFFTSKKTSGPHVSATSKRKMWTESETAMLKEGVKKFGEGSWSKIKSYYGFQDRTNVNLKDRWRNLKKTNMA